MERVLQVWTKTTLKPLVVPGGVLLLGVVALVYSGWLTSSAKWGRSICRRTCASHNAVCRLRPARSLQTAMKSSNFAIRPCRRQIVQRQR